MAIIRFSDEEVFQVDSKDYKVLENATRLIKGVEGAVVEIGTRRAGSTKIMIDVLSDNMDTNRAFFCIDPYGNIDYPYTNKGLTIHYPGQNRVKEGDPESTEIVTGIKLDYDNTMRNRIIPSLYYYAYQAGLEFTFFCLEDTEFFKRYPDGVPVYNEHKSLVNKYALVFFDGPHDTKSVVDETAFFVLRANKGSIFVYDDIWMYDHDEKVEKALLFNNGFEILEKTEHKASYRKEK